MVTKNSSLIRIMNDPTKTFLYRMKGPTESYNDIILSLIRTRRNNEDAIISGLEGLSSGVNRGIHGVNRGIPRGIFNNEELGYTLAGFGILVVFFGFLFIYPFFMKKFV